MKTIRCTDDRILIVDVTNDDIGENGGLKDGWPDGALSIYTHAFYRCTNLKHLTIPVSVTSIGESAFAQCINLTHITIPVSVTSIPRSAFALCENLTCVNISAGVTSIGESAFFFCKNLTRVIIPAGVTSIGDGAFALCENLTRVIIPAGVTSIGDRAFSGCENLTRVIIPAGVTSIGDAAFSGCENLTHITIPVSVTSISRKLFHMCNKLSTIVILTDNNEEFKRTRALLPASVRDKAIMRLYFNQVEKIKENALDFLRRSRHTSPFKMCGSEEALYRALFEPLKMPNKTALLDMLDEINTYDTSKIYVYAKKRLDRLPCPLNEKALIDFEESCMRIVFEEIDNAVSLDKHPDIHPHIPQTMSNEYGFFRKLITSEPDISEQQLYQADQKAPST